MADMLSQDEINALLGNASGGATDSNDGVSSNESVGNNNLTEQEINLLSKIGSETMAVSANTLENNLRQPVTISDPTIEKGMLSSSVTKFNEESIGVRIEYKVGVRGSNVLVLGHKDAKIISNLMQGGSGSIEDGDEELSMIDESALCEAMNQMVGSSSTVLFKILGEKVDIDTPKLFQLNLDSEAFIKNFGFENDQECIISTFTLTIGDLIDSEIVQIMPNEFAEKLMVNYNKDKTPASAPAAAPAPTPAVNAEPPMQQQVQQDFNGGGANYGNQMQMQPMQNQMAGGGQMQYNGGNVNYNNMNAKPAQFQNFDLNEVVQQKENINIIMDVPLEVTVEMGRTVRKIEEILEFSPGTIIELDKLAGDPIDILVNGKFVAKGEVVVIDENYGIRVTDIINFKNRI